jgi:predicted AAA+ superfamily ATPase
MRDLIRRKIMDSLAASVPPLTRRDIRLPGISGKATAVIGMRRTGKTTFLWQIIGDRMKLGTAREGLLYFNFEDERLAGLNGANLQWVVEEYYRLYPEWRDRKRVAFFFDEVQAVQGWESFVRRLLDTENTEIFISGSSAKLLSREVATSMRGRAMEAIVHPFSFREFLRHRRQEPKDPPERWTKSIRSAVERELESYLVQGGFPEAQAADLRDRMDLLRGYVDTAIFRDVVERRAVTHVAALRWMVRQLLGNAGGSFSVNKFYKDIRSQGLAVSKDTLHDYLGYLEDAFLIRTVFVDSNSERRRMVNPRKVYPVDPGLIPVYDRSGVAGPGHALEACVLIELERRGAEIAYVKTPGGFEVDFLARFHDGREELIQVSVDLANPQVRDREIRALLDAKGVCPKASLNIITLHEEASRNIPGKVRMHRAADWLMS